METVQLTCGNCHKLMAISTEHLGGQVRCPHCQTVVQAPPRPAPAPAPLPAAVDVVPPHVEPGEVESIFSPEAPSEDLFDAGPQRVLVEMPPEAPPHALDGVLTTDMPRGVDTAYTHTDVPADAHTDAYADPSHEPDRPPTSAETDAADLTTLKRAARPAASGFVSLMMLIFLIPYSIMMTLFVIYLWYQLANQPNPLLILPDQTKKDGARVVERAKHDQPLEAQQKVPLGGSITVGELMVTPVRVERDEFGDLRLVLHVKNVSKDQAFSPIHPDFLKVAGGKTPLPYSFLDSKTFVRLYGGHLAFRRGDKITDEGDLRPGEEEDIEVTTRDNKPVVAKIIATPDEHLTWRIQVRRGLMSAGSQRISATAVIGVQFSAREIGKGA